MEGKPAIATTAFALGARQGVFLAGLRVQENREVRTDRAEAAGLHFFRRGTDHQPVDLGHRALQQTVAHRAADFIDLHVHLRWRGG